MASEKSILHDIVEGYRHQIDKLALQQRKDWDYLPVPRNRGPRFENDFSAITAEESLYFTVGDLPLAQENKKEPEAWDVPGTISSYSAGSEVSALRAFLRIEGRGVRGRKMNDAKQDAERVLAPSPPSGVAEKRENIKLHQVGPVGHLKHLREISVETMHYHRWGRSKKGENYWKKTPVSAQLLGGEEDIGVGNLEQVAMVVELIAKSDHDGAKKLLASSVRKKLRKMTDLRRYTVNSHPALARSMERLLKMGDKEGIFALMTEAAPSIIQEFERVTGRKVVGLSVHFDSALPHWNIWHTGLEKVEYPKGKKIAVRYRRTAMDINSSGGMIAWHRTEAAFWRSGKSFAKLSPPTVRDLEKAHKRAMDRQGRLPGDWVINDRADEVLEKLLKDRGHKNLVEQGFAEFVAHEEGRYSDGLAGRSAKDLVKLAKEGADVKAQSLASEVVTLRRQLEDAKKENDRLGKLSEFAGKLFDKIIESGFGDAIRKINEGLWDLLVSVGRLVGRDLDPQMTKKKPATEPEPEPP